MVPIRKHDRADVNIVCFVLGSVDDHGPSEATSILSAVMRVIPGSSVKISLECVGHSFSGSDRALLDGRNTIKPWGVTLENAVPVESGTFLRSCDLVVDGDLERITPIGFKLRRWELIVD